MIFVLWEGNTCSPWQFYLISKKGISVLNPPLLNSGSSPLLNIVYLAMTMNQTFGKIHNHVIIHVVFNYVWKCVFLSKLLEHFHENRCRKYVLLVTWGRPPLVTTTTRILFNIFFAFLAQTYRPTTRSKGPIKRYFSNFLLWNAEYLMNCCHIWCRHPYWDPTMSL